MAAAAEAGSAFLGALRGLVMAEKPEGQWLVEGRGRTSFSERPQQLYDRT